MPSAVSAKVSDLLKKYGGGTSTGSLTHKMHLSRSSNRSVDDSSSDIDFDFDSDGEPIKTKKKPHRRLASATSLHSHRHTASHRSGRSSSNTTPTHKTVPKPRAQVSRYEADEEEISFSESESPSAVPSGRLSIQTGNGRTSKSATAQEEWESEMEGEYGDDHQHEINSAPVQKLPIPAVHTRALSAPALPKGKTQHTHSSRQAAGKLEATIEEEYGEDFQQPDARQPAAAAYKPSFSQYNMPSITSVAEEQEIEVEEEDDHSSSLAVKLPVAAPVFVIPTKKDAVEVEEIADEYDDDTTAAVPIITITQPTVSDHLTVSSSETVVPSLRVSDEYADDFEQTQTARRQAITQAQTQATDETPNISPSINRNINTVQPHSSSIRIVEPQTEASRPATPAPTTDIVVPTVEVSSTPHPALTADNIRLVQQEHQQQQAAGAGEYRHTRGRKNCCHHHHHTRGKQQTQATQTEVQDTWGMPHGYHPMWQTQSSHPAWQNAHTPYLHTPLCMHPPSQPVWQSPYSSSSYPLSSSCCHAQAAQYPYPYPYPSPYANCSLSSAPYTQVCHHYYHQPTTQTWPEAQKPTHDSLSRTQNNVSASVTSTTSTDNDKNPSSSPPPLFSVTSSFLRTSTTDSIEPVENNCLLAPKPFSFISVPPEKEVRTDEPEKHSHSTHNKQELYPTTISSSNPQGDKPGFSPTSVPTATAALSRSVSTAVRASAAELYPITARLNGNDASSIFRSQLTALLSDLASYRASLNNAFPRW